VYSALTLKLQDELSEGDTIPFAQLNSASPDRFTIYLRYIIATDLQQEIAVVATIDQHQISTWFTDTEKGAVNNPLFAFVLTLKKSNFRSSIL
jgi:hypothetical protein